MPGAGGTAFGCLALEQVPDTKGQNAFRSTTRVARDRIEAKLSHSESLRRPICSRGASERQSVAERALTSQAGPARSEAVPSRAR